LAFDAFEVGKESTRQIVFETRSHITEEAPRLVEVKSLSPSLSAQMKDRTGEEQASEGIRIRQWRIDVTLKSSVLTDGQTLVTLVYDWKGDRRETSLPVNWHARSVYRFQPETAFFIYSSTEQEGLRKRIALRRGDGQSFKILSAKTSDPVFTCDFDQDSMPLHALSIQFRPKDLTGSVFGSLVIQTDCKAEAVVTLPLAAFKHGPSDEGTRD
jgi:hypothetical protein